MAKAQWRQPQRRGILNLFLTWLLFCLVSSENWLISWSQQASENWLIFVEDQFLHSSWLSFLRVLPSWLCIQDPSSCLRSLALPAILSPSWSAPQLFFRPGLPSAAPAPPSYRLSGALLPLENSALTPPLAHPLPCSPLIEMLMRLLWLPALPGGRAPWPGRCTCQGS